MITSTGNDELRALLALLTSSVNAIVESDAPLPSLQDPNPELPRSNRDTSVAIAAATQLKALLEGPLFGIGQVFTLHVPSCLRLAIEAHVVETIRESGKAEGLHVTEIAKSSAIDPAKLGEILRLLAAHHFFIETSAGVFANNRTSIGFDTGRSGAELNAADQGMKASSHLADVLLDPKTSHSYAPNETGYQRGHNTSLTIWEHMTLPGAEPQFARFNKAMHGSNVLSGGAKPSVSSEVFDFKHLGEGSVVVDVGGGTGAVSLLLAEEAPHVNLVLEDRSEVITGGTRPLWEKEHAELLTSGRVKLVEHDFFTAQPITGADVYFLRWIIHDWPDEEASAILSHLAAAASPSTKLVLIEQIIDTLFWPDGAAPSNIYPLLPTLGASFQTLLDAQMLVALNGQERTEEQHRKLGRASGWELEKVHRGENGGWDQLVFAKA
ncbi:S-adenosyl-L-methionine-dependent methyltransferase [Pseudohyphozyma bogoriensis]|nr:S-adenosyl-L-methionine-dependent methyltransferase [Pseudohyphozyma bogoriensis]